MFNTTDVKKSTALELYTNENIIKDKNKFSCAVVSYGKNRLFVSCHKDQVINMIKHANYVLKTFMILTYSYCSALY